MVENIQAKSETKGGAKAMSKAGKSAGAFRTISEVSSDLDIPQHVLRFWETKFTQVKPMKRAGGRRYYRPEDVQLLSRIRDLLYSEGYTIRGVQKLLRDKGPKGLLADPETVQDEASSSEDVVETSRKKGKANAAAPVDDSPQGLLFPIGPAGLPASTKTVLREVLAELQEIRAAL